MSKHCPTLFALVVVLLAAGRLGAAESWSPSLLWPFGKETKAAPPTGNTAWSDSQVVAGWAGQPSQPKQPSMWTRFTSSTKQAWRKTTAAVTPSWLKPSPPPPKEPLSVKNWLGQPRVGEQ